MLRPGSHLATYLYLNGVTSRHLELALLSRRGVVRERVVRDGTRTEKLLPAVATFLKNRGVAGIMVAQGGGSFSQTRIICTVANALAYGWGVKVVGVSSKLSPEQLIGKLSKLRWQRLILPQYSGPGVR